jgi:sigma-E factor negative regulatory protein RseA
MKYVEPELMSLHEQWSALHDGELSSEQAQALVRASLADENLMAQWRSMSAIGSVLREQQSGLAQPALAASPAWLQAPPAEATNDGVFRWKMVAGLAAFAAVGSLSWGLLSSSGENTGARNPVLAQSQTAPATLSAPPGLIAVGGQIAGQEVTMIRDPRLDELLAAHKQFGGVSALQQPAGSLRSVSLATLRP